ncbi:MAG: YebC/PmpR family DNA-binding transcriptional regulator [Muribaculaceae bacterium]|nr:YebC/PmpR family DNA-binding transcriptional regulator [Muribaculaceae bacterium]
MGRAFEYRKARKLKRWGNMSRTFTRIGKEITIAAKAGGPDPSTNPRLRALMQNAKAANMPKDTVERAIKKATDKDAGDYKEIVYEGYGPFGIAIVVEAATDNNTRTVANVRSYFTKHGGTLGTQGSLSFMFDHKSVFKIKPKDGVSLEDLELELIDYGVDELEDIVDDESGEEQVVLYGAFEEYSNIQKYLEDNGFEIISSEFERIPHDLKERKDIVSFLCHLYFETRLC